MIPVVSEPSVGSDRIFPTLPIAVDAYRQWRRRDQPSAGGSPS